jgi:hypothetical protein
MRKSGVLTSMVVLISLIFAVSCVTKEVPVTEVYYETEYKAEEYRTTEQYELKTPHATPLFHITRATYSPFILFNMGRDGALYWAELERGQASLVKKLHLEPTGQNHRISVTEPLCWVTICRDRDQNASTNGFKPTYQVIFPSSTMTIIFPKYMWAGTPAALAFGDPSMVKEWTKNQKDSAMIDLQRDIQKGDVIPGFPSAAQRYGAIPMEFGFDVSKDAIDVCDILNLPKETKLKDIEPPYDFPLEVMFQKGEWCLLEVSATEMISIDYIWDSVENRTREATKTRQVPYQVEKQRTVMQTKKVPFWEVVFSK